MYMCFATINFIPVTALKKTQSLEDGQKHAVLGKDRVGWDNAWFQYTLNA